MLTACNSTGVCIQKVQQEVKGPLCKIAIGTLQPVWRWRQEGLLEVQVTYPDDALVVGNAPGDSSAVLAIDPGLHNPCLKESRHSTKPFISHEGGYTRILTCE